MYNGLTMMEAMAEAATFCRNMDQHGLADAVEQGIEWIRDTSDGAFPSEDPTETEDPLPPPSPPEPSEDSVIMGECVTAFDAVREILAGATKADHKGAIKTAQAVLDATGSNEQLWRAAHDGLVAITAMRQLDDRLRGIAAEALARMPKACLRFRP